MSIDIQVLDNLIEVRRTAWVIYDAKAMGLNEIREVVEATGEAYSVTSAEQLEDLNP